MMPTFNAWSKSHGIFPCRLNIPIFCNLAFLELWFKRSLWCKRHRYLHNILVWSRWCPMWVVGFFRHGFTFRGRRSTSWSATVTFRVRRSIWWSSSVTFGGRCSTWWRSSVTFGGTCSTWWRFECKIGRETMYFTIENARWARKVTSVARRVVVCVFVVGSFSDHGRIILGSSLHWKCRFICFQRFCQKVCNAILRGRRSIWWGWIVTPVATRIVNEVSYVMRTKYASLSGWQAQYLVRLDRDTCCSAHCKWGCICNHD